MPGRTGDTGTIGAGTYATTRSAVSCTGDGDRIVPSGLAVSLDAYLECGLTAESALDLAVTRIADYGGHGGFICLMPDGRAFVRANVEVIRAVASCPGADEENDVVMRTLRVDRVALVLKPEATGWRVSYHRGFDEDLVEIYELRDSMRQWLRAHRQAFIREEQQMSLHADHYGELSAA